MRNQAYTYGGLLLALGIIFYVATSAVSYTALIPSIFGAALCLCAYLAAKETYRKNAMHAATIVALIGMIASAPGFYQLVPLAFGNPIERPSAVAEQAVMCILCAAFVLTAAKCYREACKGARS
jgi:hypothetical protein